MRLLSSYLVPKRFSDGQEEATNATIFIEYTTYDLSTLELAGCIERIAKGIQFRRGKLQLTRATRENLFTL
ncbi:MAG: hypothetical protein EOO43_20070 [Flavobacterium sp.]|nr:MAG: hypothetical protein EOO43_20070 [Flavobacterium sp.]